MVTEENLLGITIVGKPEMRQLASWCAPHGLSPGVVKSSIEAAVTETFKGRDIKDKEVRIFLRIVEDGKRKGVEVRYVLLTGYSHILEKMRDKRITTKALQEIAEIMLGENPFINTSSPEALARCLAGTAKSANITVMEE